jgi:hypothetical protein
MKLSMAELRELGRLERILDRAAARAGKAQESYHRALIRWHDYGHALRAKRDKGRKA